MDGQEARRFLLTFRDAETETAFLVGRQVQLVLGLRYLAWAVWAACIIGWLWVGVFYGRLGNAPNKVYVSQICTIGLLHACSSLLILSTWRVKWYRAVKPGLVEAMSVTLLLALAPLLFFIDGYYSCRILEGLDPRGHYAVSYSDSRILLVLLTTSVAGHLLLSIRSSRMFFFDVVVNLIYIAASLLVGGPEGTSNSFLNICMLGIATWITAIGHQKMDRLERADFARIREASTDLIRERVLRVQTEFELDQRKRAETGNGPAVHADGSESGISSIIAGGEPEMLELRLTFLRSLGEMEHWYIPTENLIVDWQVPLGKGGFGAVYQGRWHHSSVAAKTVATSLTASLEEGHHKRVDALLNEIRLLRRLRHPHIITFYGACIVDSSLQIVVVEELLKGRSLEQFIGQSSSSCQDQPWGECGLGRIILGICAGIVHLHDQQPVIIHGDLKPANVMLTLDSTPKLVDFGLSRLLSKERHFGHSQGWTAPEVYQKHAAKSSSADVFSFGCIVFFVGTSVKPFEKRNMGQSNVNLPWRPLLSDFQVQSKALCDVSVVLEPEGRSSAKVLLDMLAGMAKESTQAILKL